MTFDFADTGGLEDGADEPWKAPPGDFVGTASSATVSAVCPQLSSGLDGRVPPSSFVVDEPQACCENDRSFRLETRFSELDQLSPPSRANPAKSN